MGSDVSERHLALPKAMKAQLKARITAVEKAGGDVTLHLDTPTAGKVSVRAINAQDVYFSGNLKLKELVANEIKIGALITITVSDEEAEQRLD
jgi:hypothetical protein